MADRRIEQWGAAAARTVSGFGRDGRMPIPEPSAWRLLSCALLELALLAELPPPPELVLPVAAPLVTADARLTSGEERRLRLGACGDAKRMLELPALKAGRRDRLETSGVMQPPLP